jgi:hypothetical protein
MDEGSSPTPGVEFVSHANLTQSTGSSFRVKSVTNSTEPGPTLLNFNLTAVKLTGRDFRPKA